MAAHASSRVRHLAVLGAACLLAACVDDAVQPPATVPATAGAMFNSYVAIGNSITSGFESGGINDSTQQNSYAVLLGQQMGTTFNAPLLNRPGCPPPLVNVFTQEPLSSIPCALRARPIPGVIHNVAVPGADVFDVTANLGAGGSANTLTTLFLGGRTQLEVAAEAAPTFVTVWIGNGDVLSSITRTDALAGDPSTVTPVGDFQARYDDVVEGLEALSTIEGGVLIGAVQVAFAPYLTAGPAWEAFEQGFDATTQPLNALDVMANCSVGQQIPGTTQMVFPTIPFHVGGPALSLASARADSVANGQLPPQNLVPVTLDCSAPQNISLAEMLNLFQTVAQYNAIIAAAATELGFAFIDPNTLLLQLLQDPTAIRPFPAFPGTVADPTVSETAPFGTALSRDGIHPSASAHRIVANALIQTINATYGSSIPALP